MCGIAGVFNLDGTTVSEAVIESMTAALTHRGPDGRGTWLRENIGLGHRRLAVLDTSLRGRQPMASKDGKWVLVFNGCIYNFRELRRELSDLGHEFATGTDTEVITEGLAAWGL